MQTEGAQTNRLSRRIAIALALAAVAACGCRRQAVSAPAAVAATNSYLECVARDLLGPDTAVMRLAEPGMCPGHFDVRPSQAEALRRARVLLRFDFQRSLDAVVGGASGSGPRVAEVRIAGGLCEPDSYLIACHQTADALVDCGLLDRAAADRRLDEIAKRVEETASRCRRQTGGLEGLPVLASAHQEAFCRWLGLNVVATFAAADLATVADVDRAVREGERFGARLVVANLPEGRRTADALAERLGAKVVVFGNFPALGSGQESFDDLLADNITRLAEAAEP